MSSLVLLIYSTRESPSQTISETLLSFVSWLISPVFKSIRLHQDEDSWVSKEYCDVENKAAFYVIPMSDIWSANKSIPILDVQNIRQMDWAQLRLSLGQKSFACQCQ